jgi:hypothetical protein
VFHFRFSVSMSHLIEVPGATIRPSDLSGSVRGMAREVLSGP